MRKTSLVLAMACLTLAAAPGRATLSPEAAQAFEIRAALVHLSHLRTLAQRISRQHLLAQTRVVEGNRPAMLRSARQMDALLRAFDQGEALLSIPAPPTRELEQAVDAIEAAWAPLRTLALASPSNFARRSGLEGNMPPGDPLLLRHADGLASAFDARVEAAVASYLLLCEESGFAGCQVDPSATAPTALERLAKDSAFFVQGIEQRKRRLRIEQARDAFGQALGESVGSPRVQAASTGQGAASGLIPRIAGRIDQRWSELRAEVDRLLAGDSDPADLERMLRLQSELLYSFHRLSVALLAADTPLLAGGSPEAALFRYEYVSAQRWLGRMRALAQRLNKDNLLYRLRIEDSYKLDSLAIATADQVDDALHTLRAGDTRTGMAAPPSPELDAALAALEQRWTPIRQMAQANPFEYLRGDRLFANPPSARPDPLLLHYFDGVVAGFVLAVDDVVQMYTLTCEQDGYDRCDTGLQAGRAEMLTELLVSEAIRRFAGIDSGTRLEEHRAAFDAFMTSPAGRPEVDAAIQRAAGPEARHAGVLLDESRRTWSALRRELEFVREGSAEARNLQRAIDLQRDFAVQLERLQVAVARVNLFEQPGADALRRMDVAAPPPTTESTPSAP